MRVVVGKNLKFVPKNRYVSIPIRSRFLIIHDPRCGRPARGEYLLPAGLPWLKILVWMIIQGQRISRIGSLGIRRRKGDTSAPSGRMFKSRWPS
jgi:hypothetical protein